jgi:hypothetical protein
LSPLAPLAGSGWDEGWIRVTASPRFRRSRFELDAVAGLLEDVAADMVAG